MRPVCEQPITAWMIRHNDLVVMHPIGPDCRTVVEVSHGLLDHQVRVTFASMMKCAVID